jgi:hypothetical protein
MPPVESLDAELRGSGPAKFLEGRTDEGCEELSDLFAPQGAAVHYRENLDRIPAKIF